MTNTQDTQAQYAKALERAYANGLQVAGKGTLKETGERFIAVTSCTEAHRWHLVVVHKSHLSCDCRAGQYHPSRPCAHRALAREALQREAAKRVMREPTAILARVSASLDESERRETAPMRQRPAFSIWASASYGHSARARADRLVVGQEARVC